jgi:hypothetical protein
VARLAEFVGQLKRLVGLGLGIRPPVVVKILGRGYPQQPRQHAERPLGAESAHSPDAEIMPFVAPAQPAQAGQPLHAARTIRGTRLARRLCGYRVLDKRGSFAVMPGEHGGQPREEVGGGLKVRMRCSQRTQVSGGGRRAVRIGVPPAGKRGVGQSVGGGLRVVALEQRRRGGEQI